MVERKIIRFLYIKIIAAAIAAISLCVVASWVTNVWSNLWLAVLMLLGFGYTLFSVYSAEQKGQIVSIQATCIGAMDIESVFDKMHKNRTYRFIAESNMSETDSLYIQAERGKFREGETYCLLFRKNPSGTFNEKNLLTYGAIPPDFGAESVKQPEPSNAIRYEDIMRGGESED